MHLRMTLAGVCAEPVTLRAPRLRNSTTVPPLAVARATCRTADTHLFVTLLIIHHVLILITMPVGGWGRQFRHCWPYEKLNSVNEGNGVIVFENFTKIIDVKTKIGTATLTCINFFTY